MVLLTIPQQNIWNLQQYYEDTCISNICGSVLWERKYDVETVKQAINKVIELQSGLRLHFCEKDGDIVQYVSNFTYRQIPFHSFAGIDEFRCYANEFAKKPFAQIDSDMFNFEIAEINGKIGVLACMSHLISDAWSFSLLVKNVTYICECIEKHTEIDLASENYLEYVESEANFLSSPRFQKAKRYWEEKYSAQPENSPIKMLPSAISVPTAKRFSMQLSADDSRSLDRFCNDTGINQAVLFEAALFTYLKSLNPDNHAVTVGVPVLNRAGLERNIIGMFISTMPLTVEISEDYSVLKLCDEITTAHAQLFRYQKYPYSYILSDLRKKSNFSGNLYDVMISYQNAKTDSEAKTEWYSNGYSETPFVIHIDNRDSEDSYTLTVDYQTEVFKQDDEIGFIINRLIYIIKQMIENPEITLSKIDIIPEKEYEQLVFGFNDTVVEYDTGKCVHEIFETVVTSHSEETAVIACDRTLTYGELDKEANKIANALIGVGVKNNDIVAIVLPREAAFISAMLGVLKAGGAYMPVAYDYPIERINYMLESSKAKCIITTFELKEKFNSSLVIDLLLDEGNSAAPSIPVNFDDIFCALHTSGSTGKPKMAALTHRNAVNFIYANRYMFNGINQSVCSTIVTFDVFFQETLAALCSELPIVLLSEEQITNQNEFEKIYESYDHSFSFFTPTKINSYIKNSLTRNFLKHIDTYCLGGEIISHELVETLYNNGNNTFCVYGPTETLVYSTAKKVDIFFVYGPTETTIWSTNSKLDMSDITIGKPIANTQVYILDKNRKVLPIGVAGELCISGDGVGAGYLNQPALTSEKYIPNPFIDGKIMYCTGDLARWRTDGEIEFIGRIDNQIKLHGQRVELGEIESVMSEFGGIKITAVTDKKDENGHQYLVGYYTTDRDIDEKALRQHLGVKLPKYMIPNYFVCLDEMPMTPSGKIDRKNLPLPKFDVVEDTDYIAPETEIEIRLSEIWESILKNNHVGKKDEFFDLGGDSLMAITLLNKIENEFEIKMSMKDLMENPSLEAMSLKIFNCDASKDAILALNSDKYAILPQQKAIYAICSKNPKALTYNIPAKIKLNSKIDRNALEAAFKYVVENNRSLKTKFIADENDVYGIYDENAVITIEQYTEENYSDFVRPFDLSKAPLIRVGFTERSLLIDIHHIVSDGESLNIILSELFSSYNGAELTKKKIQYSDYAEYFKKQNFSKHMDYFKNMLKCDFEPVILPEKKQYGKHIGKSKFYTVGNEHFIKAKKYARQNGITDTMLFFGAFGLLLSKFTAKQEILTSIVLTNRTHNETKDIVGMFVNTLPVALNVKENLTDYYNHIKSVMLNLFEYQELPFYEIAEAVNMTDKNIINTSFVYQADGQKKLIIGENAFAPEFIETNTSKFDLSFEMTPFDGGCGVRMEYDSGKYDDSFIDRFFDGFLRIIEQLDKVNTSDISVMGIEEYQKVIFDFNDTYVDYPMDKCVHQLFCEQADKVPNQSAVVFEGNSYTYKQIDEMSNSLAHILRRKGILPNDIVPIIAHRSYLILVAMLGVLKAGGAYMPIDPTYPIERIEYMTSEAKSKFALTLGYNEKLNVDIIDLQTADYLFNTASVDNTNKSDDLCYIIFTSGSTGKPKATMLTHNTVCNYTNNNNNNVVNKIINVNCKSIVSVTNIVFDIFVTESLLPLLNGLCIYFANDEETYSQKKISNLIVKNNIDVIQTTPSKMRGYLIDKDNIAYLNVLQTIILGGEALPADLCRFIEANSDAKIFNIYGPAETTVWSTNAEIYRDEFPLHELIEKAANSNKEKTAVFASDEDLTFGTISKYSNRVAQYLILKGVKRGDVVALKMSRTSLLIPTLIGVLKCGAAYMPIDPDYPNDRIQFMLTDSNAEICLEDADIKSCLMNTTVDDDPKISVGIDDKCCIIYTSGSTGTPKGCVLTHRGVTNFARHNNIFQHFSEKEEIIGISINNVTFDYFIAETFVLLSRGFSVVLATKEQSINSDEFWKLCDKYNVNIIQTTPTRINLLFKKPYNKLRLVVSSGEALTTELIEKIRKVTDAEIINPLGPSETSVWVADGEGNNDIDITIGKPIANTQIYILDHNRKPLPIGVAGELCISGNGVGKGYLNRPELTAEKFIPNPFISGKIMYCTGDLARWRADGNIEYLGRIDTQVKIRGLRIELGEIESVMNTFVGMKITAVSDKRDENGRQYLVGYYTADSNIDEKVLRQHLGSKLPKYMIPNYFVCLDEMPMTPSGKIDRKNLPLPNFSIFSEKYQAPKTESEIILCSLLSELFGTEKIGVSDNFFDIGGDSLKAIEYTAKAHNRGVNISLQNVFDYPTVGELCDFLENGTLKTKSYTTADFEKYDNILKRNVIDESFGPKKRSLGNVLITGATGFLGAHILNSVMESEKGKVYCLVRSNSENDRRGRIAELLNYYFGNKYDNEIGKRIIPIVGDITEKGLSSDAPKNVQTVIHTAATVKHYGSYDYFRNVNVEGTQNVVDYAKSVNAKLVHISTLSVSGNSFADEFEVYRSEEEKNFYESSLYIEQPLENVYVRSKFEAELAVFDAMLYGLDAKIIRVGNLTNRLSDCKFQPNYQSNAFLTRFKAALDLGIIPDYLLPLYAEFSPVDQTADGVVKIAQYADKQCVFHLNSNRPIYFDRMLEILEELGINMKVVTGQRFNETLEELAKNANTEYIYEAFQNDMDDNGQLVYDSNINIKNDFTVWFMKKIGFEWEKLDIDYIRAYIQYFKAIEYFR